MPPNDTPTLADLKSLLTRFAEERADLPPAEREADYAALLHCIHDLAHRHGIDLTPTVRSRSNVNADRD